MRKDCSCGGTNENCYRCFGRGYYEADSDISDPSINLKPIEQLPIPRKKHNNKHKKIRKTGEIAKVTKFVICPYCEVPVADTDILLHLIQSHKKDIHYKNGKANPKYNPKAKIKCPHFSILVEANKINGHIEKVHNKSPVKQDKSNYTKALDKEESKCPYCNSIVKKGNLNKHINKAHRYKAKPNISSKSEQNQNTTKNIPNSLGNFVIKEKDGAHGWHNYRDNGRYGSFPSFDPMDDESTPD